MSPPINSITPPSKKDPRKPRLPHGHAADRRTDRIADLYRGADQPEREANLMRRRGGSNQRGGRGLRAGHPALHQAHG
jgi:hypothetical protein